MSSEELYSSWGRPILEEIETIKFLEGGDFDRSRLFSFAGDDFYTLLFVQKKLMERFEEAFPLLVAGLCDTHGIPNRKIEIPGAGKANGPLCSSSVVVVQRDGADVAVCFTNNPLALIKDGAGVKSKIKEELSRHGVPPDNVIVASITDDEVYSPWYENHAPRSFSDDPSQHMDAICLFRLLFGDEEAESFRNYLAAVRAESSLACGIQTTALPTGNELALFKEDRRHAFAEKSRSKVEETIRGYGAGIGLVAALGEKVVGGGWLECLFGNADFAESFVSSEWRRRSDAPSGHLEQTGTVAGYLKCVEQLGFSILEFLAKTGSSFITLRSRRNQRGGPWGEKAYEAGEVITTERPRGEYEQSCYRYPLTEDFLKARGREVTLGTMRVFFSHKELCGDIFDAAVEGAGVEGAPLAAVIGKAIGDFADQMRNDKFHKTNFTDEGEVEAIRLRALAIAWLLLGGVDLGSRQRAELLGGDPDQGMLEILVDGIRTAVRSLGQEGASGYDSMRFFLPREKNPEGKWMPSVYLGNEGDQCSGGCPVVNIYTDWRGSDEPTEALGLFEKAVQLFLEDALEEDSWISRLSSISLISPIAEGSSCKWNREGGKLEKVRQPAK